MSSSRPNLHLGGDSSDGDDDAVVGPALPPHLLQKMKKTSAPAPDNDEETVGSIGPALPPHLMARQRENNDDDDEEDGAKTFSVQLPPGYRSQNVGGTSNQREGPSSGGRIPQRLGEEEEEEEDQFGPALPPGFKKPKPSECEERTAAQRNYGPSLPPGSYGNQERISYPDEDDSDSDDSEDEMIGPMPLRLGSHAGGLSAAEEFEKRAAAMRKKLEDKNLPQQPERDTWMTELPGYSTNFGLGARSFRKTARPEEKDRSGWTDTPADKARKEQERAAKKQAEEAAWRSGKKAKRKEKEEGQGQLSQRDQRLAALVSKHNETKRGESLVDMHTKDRKRKLEEEGEKPYERRPFDRDLDLKANQFDDARRKLLIKKSAQLNDKFSHGKDKVFL